jgi:two-component system OmpR family response regulator
MSLTGPAEEACAMAGTVLVVDDDPHIREVIRFALDKSGFQTCEAVDGSDALKKFADRKPDLIVLDINMPELDGLDVCRAIRRSSDIPILFLSSRDEEVDRIVGLEIGGDDYVSKPFSPRELVARVKVILKRLRPLEPPSPDPATLSHGLLRLDPAQHATSYAGRPVSLTATEFAILREFLKRPQHVRDRNSLIESAYALNVHVSDRTVDSHIRHIRMKFEAVGCESVIETVHGVGYKLGPCR